MTKKTKLYTFPHKSKKAMIDYILDCKSRGYHGQIYNFCWNVKAHNANLDSDSLRKHSPDLSPKFDSKWEDEKVDNPELFYQFLADAGRDYVYPDNLWTSYPGDDQGKWEFTFVGASGGWLALLKYDGIDVNGLYTDPEEAREYRESGYDLQDGGKNLDNWPFERLRAFYRGIRCAEVDFTPEKAAAEVEFQAAFYRETLESLWKDELDEKLTLQAERMEASRPDMMLQSAGAA